MRRALSTPPTIAAGSLAAAAQPVLTAGGGRVVLRPWEAGDAAVFLAAYQDPEIRRWHTRRPADEATVHEWFAGYRRDWAQEKGAHWAVTGDGGAAVLGRIATAGWNLDDGDAGIGYWTLPAARGAGVATTALGTLAEWLLAEAGFARLHLDHSTRNAASCRVATKAGFRAEGVKRGAAVHDDGRHDMHLHARIVGD